MVQFTGHYKLDKNEDFVEYLEALGSSDDMIKMVTTPNATTEVIKEGNTYIIKSNSNADITLVIGEEIDEVLPTGMPIKTIATIEGDQIVVNSSAADNRRRSRIYKFSDDGYVVTLTVGDLVAKRFFSRV